VLGFLIGVGIGLIGTNTFPVGASGQITGLIGKYAWWIVVLSLLIPFLDYLTGIRTTFMGIVTRHPYRHLAGFFTGLAFGLGLFLLIAARILG
jgi:hypothetical protein